MDLQQLRYVIALAEERHFTRAAARCHVVQSALSRSIRTLEAELGVPLFARSSRRVEPTAAGEAFLASALVAVRAADRAAADAAASAGVVRGRLDIGVIPTVTAIDLAAELGAFRREHPDVRIGLRMAGSVELERAVADGDVDVAFIGLVEGRAPRSRSSRLLRRERLQVCVPGADPLAGRGAVSLADLAPRTFVDFPSGSAGRQQSDDAFSAAGLVREVAFETTTVDLAIEIVREGLAVALLPPGIANGAHGVTSIHVSDGPVRTEHVVWNDFNTGAATRAFLDRLPPADEAVAGGGAPPRRAPSPQDPTVARPTR